jgi:hypothetical protein
MKHIYSSGDYLKMYGFGCGSDDYEKEATKEAVMVPCKYCNMLFSQSATFCPPCGARRAV